MLDQLGEEGVRLRTEQAHRFDIRALAPENLEARWAWADPDEVLAEVRCPVHLVAGQYDLGGAMDAEDVRRAAAAIPDCTVTVLETAGHSIHSERPGEYVSELRGFLMAL